MFENLLEKLIVLSARNLFVRNVLRLITKNYLVKISFLSYKELKITISVIVLNAEHSVRRIVGAIMRSAWSATMNGVGYVGLNIIALFTLLH